MLLNRVEYLLMNNPLRAAIQRGWEGRRLLAMGGPTNGGRVLEIGCGRGVGVEIILDLFGASHVDAFDLDPRMVKTAARRLRHRADRVSVWQGDVTSIPRPDACYDAVFDFGIIHHVPSWRDALAEVWRVLKPGGRFYAEEVFDRFIQGFPWRKLLNHPREDRFDAVGFSTALTAARFQVKCVRETAGWFGWFVADKPGEE
jgi:ubiquinone/menaquinone biosynthesis C-methylase UbiE